MRRLHRRVLLGRSQIWAGQETAGKLLGLKLDVLAYLVSHTVGART